MTLDESRQTRADKGSGCRSFVATRSSGCVACAEAGISRTLCEPSARCYDESGSVSMGNSGGAGNASGTANPTGTAG